MAFSSKIKPFLLSLFKFCFGFGIVGYLIASGRLNFSKIKYVFFHSPWILLAFVLGFCALCVITVRWRILLRTQGVVITYFQALKLVFIGQFFNTVIPGTVSGDVVKIYYITQHHPQDKIAAGFSVLMDRLVGLIFLVVLTFSAVMLNAPFIHSIPELKIIGYIVIAIFVISLTSLLFFISKKEIILHARLPKFLHRLVSVVWAYRKHVDRIFISGGLTIINFILHTILFFSASRALGEGMVSFGQYLFLVPIGFFVMAIPISPAGIGVGQGIFLKLFEWIYQKPITIGAEIITLYQMVMFCWAFVGLIVYILNKSQKQGVEKHHIDSRWSSSSMKTEVKDDRVTL